MAAEGNVSKRIRLASALLLTACFFMPMTRFGDTFVPFWYLLDCMDQNRFDLSLVITAAAHLFGLLVVLLTLCDLLEAGRLLRSALAACLFPLVAIGIGLVYVGIYTLFYRQGGRSPLLVYFLWPLLGVLAWSSINVFRPSYPLTTKLAVWQLSGSVIATLWCLLLLFGSWILDAVHYGLCLSVLSSFVLAVGFADECRQRMACTWMGLVPGLMGFGRRS